MKIFFKKFLVYFIFILSVLLVLGGGLIFDSGSCRAATGDAIAIRVVPNPDHYSAWRWYQMRGFVGAPQSLMVDGYEAVRDGRTVYVNVANVAVDKLYTNIYLISYNQDAESVTEDIFSKILSHWSFNLNYNTVGVCRQNKDIVCLNDISCPINDYCDSHKARVSRDTKRLADLEEIDLVMSDYYKRGYYPKLAAGSYLPDKTISVWPSWNQTLAKELNINLPIDPVNKLGACPGYNEKTCWDEKTKTFATAIPALPKNSLVYSYFTDLDGIVKNFCVVLESGLKVQNLNLLSADCPDICQDFDGDGYGNPATADCLFPQLDCDDMNPAVTIGAAEICNDNSDNDCDGFLDCADNDCAADPACVAAGDVSPTCPDGFCDPGANECNTCLVDCNTPKGKTACCGVGGCNPALGECAKCRNDCLGSAACCGDGACDALLNENVFACSVDCLSNCVDGDGDGYDTCNIIDAGDDGKPVDCQDNNSSIHPGEPELCDGLDNDCDTFIDNGFTAENCAFICEALNTSNDYDNSRSGDLKCCGNDVREAGPYQSGEKTPLDLCSDNKDNDCDGVVDLDDADCQI